MRNEELDKSFKAKKTPNRIIVNQTSHNSGQVKQSGQATG